MNELLKRAKECEFLTDVGENESRLRDVGDCQCLHN